MRGLAARAGLTPIIRPCRTSTPLHADVQSVLLALSAAAASAVEILEALAIVFAVGATRDWTDAVLGALAGALACAVLAAVLAPVLGEVDIHLLRLLIGTALLWLGFSWLRKNTLRLAGRRPRASSRHEYDETIDTLAGLRTAASGPDWTARAVAFKGVLLEGFEVVLIVSALAARPGGAAPAVVGAATSLVVVLGIGVVLREPLSRIPETELKWGVGVLLTAFGLFFAAEGAGLAWPGGDAALLYIAAALALGSLAVARKLHRRPLAPPI